MRGLLSLLSINLSGKLVSIFVFAFIARVLEAEHLAYIGLIPALSGLLLALLGFGVGTLLERDVPRLRITDPDRADSLMRSGFLVAASSVLSMFVLLLLFMNFWTSIFLGGYSFQASLIGWITLPIAGYMLLDINGWMLIIRGEVRNYGVIRVYGDISAKTGALVFYFWRPSELSVFIGLALGQAPFLLAALWLQRKWLFKGPISSPVALIRSSGVFYTESVFQMLRDRGDSLLVSSVLGPLAMASYYVAKTVAAQLTVLYSPVTSIIIPSFSSRFAFGKDELALIFRKVWSLAPPLFIWMASSVAAAAPFLLAVIAGRDYAETWQTALILCYVVAAMSVYAIASRILLILGSSMERFRVVMIHAALLAGFVLLVRDRFGPEGVALSWLLAATLTLLVVRMRASRIGFDWPAATALRRSLVICIPVPLVMLYLVGYGDHPDWGYIALSGGLSLLSLLGLLSIQDSFEEQQMLTAMPRQLARVYRLIRRVTHRD